MSDPSTPDVGMHTKAFWHATAERAISTMAESAIGTIVVAGVGGLMGVDWRALASVTLAAGAVAVLKALAANRVGLPGPSLTSVESLTDQ